MLLAAAVLAWATPYDLTVKWGVLIGAVIYTCLQASDFLISIFQSVLKQGRPGICWPFPRPWARGAGLSALGEAEADRGQWHLSCDRIGALGGGRLADLGFLIFGCADLRMKPGQ